MVKHTFLQLKSDVQSPGRRARASSDSFLYENLSERGSAKMADESDQETDVESGFSGESDISQSFCSSEPDASAEEQRSRIATETSPTNDSVLMPTMPAGCWWQQVAIGANGQQFAMPMMVQMPVGCFAVPMVSQPSACDSQRANLPSGRSVRTVHGQSWRQGTNSSVRIEQPPKVASTPVLRTTVYMKNLPSSLTREDLLALFDSCGFAQQYDFVYLPLDFAKQVTLGYAFVNLVTPAIAERFWNVFAGFSDWKVPSDDVCELLWSQTYQGLQMHVDRYRNSPLLHEAVPDNCRPMLFKDGERIAFPPPTKPIKAPRLKNGRVTPFWDKESSA